MSTTTSSGPAAPAAPARALPDVERASAWCGVAFTACQLSVMVAMAIFVLPRGGSLSDSALLRGTHVHDAATAYRIGNFLFIAAGSVLLGFLGVVQARLRRVDASGTLAGIALVSGGLLSVIWPFGGVLHDVALSTADAGTDLRILAGWDAIAPYCLAFSVFARVFFVGTIALGLRHGGGPSWLVRAALVIVVLSLAGSGTLVVGELFPLLALSTLGYELWVGAVAWHWLQRRR
jgi:hypothetical protein